MTNGRLNTIWWQLRHLVRPAARGPESDSVLLDRFVQHRDEAAFATLVERHGAMVWHTCRRILQEDSATDDAFQASFLVLACRAHTVRKGESLPGWLHGTAFRVAAKARTSMARRRKHEAQAAIQTEADARAGTVDSDVREVIDEELSRLPDKYRLPLVLCYLEGQTNEAAAAQLCWTKGTLAGRLSRARDLLRGRLSRRGLAVTPAMLASTWITPPVHATVPAGLAASTTHAAALCTGGNPSAAGVSSSVLILIQGALTPMKVNTLGFVGIMVCALVGLVALTGVGLGAGALVYFMSASKPAAPADTKVRSLARPTGARLPMGGQEVLTFATRKQLFQGLRKLLIQGLEERKKYGVHVPVTEAARNENAARITKQLAGQIDFTKEQVVYIRWSTGGPPFGRLKHEAKKGDNQTIVFYVQGPGAGPRGEAARHDNIWLAVPANKKVFFDSRER